jgi:hypothetical protein
MPILEAPFDEAKRIIEMTEQKGIALKLVGGLAIRFRCPSAAKDLARKYLDLDFVGHSKQSGDIKKLFVELGYVPRDRFNAMQGDRRLIFNDLEHQRRVDIFLDVFEMCHKFNFKDRLTQDKYTLPLADLLMTKLQIVAINEKDYKDIVSLLLDHDIADTNTSEKIDGAYIASFCGQDWGICKTFTTNLNNVLTSIDTFSFAGDMGNERKKIVIERVTKLIGMIEKEPKSFKWKLRARVGEKVPWYELPEADKQVVDSRISGGPEGPNGP